MSTVVVVGEVVLDRFVRPDGTQDVAGGSAANTALALHCAGHTASLRARYSTDADGQFLFDTACDLGLDLSASVRTSDPATVVRIQLSADGVPHYDFQMDGTADWQWSSSEIAAPLPAGCDAVILGSLAAVLQPGYSVLRAWAEDVTAAGITLAYDPNARPTALAGFDSDEIRERIRDWVLAAEIVKVSDEDLAWIAPGADPVATVADWSTWGPQVVVLTGGPQGAWAARAGEVIAHVAAPSIDVVDTVGAGDTLMAWLVGGLMDSPATQRYGHDVVERVLQRAVRAAAVTCTRRGCQPPAPSDVV